MNEELKQILINRPERKGMYINKAGEWLSYPREGFDFVSREEILGDNSNDSGSADDNSDRSNKKNKKNK